VIVGLTGGIGSGKSTVAQIFKTFGIVVVDADAVAREVVEPGTEALAQITEHFGTEILNSDGSLNRAELRSKIFEDGKEKNWLENLLHPIIRREMLHQLEEADTVYKILEAPLLFENKLQDLCTKSILVDLNPEQQINRSSQRDFVSEESIQRIIDAQMSREDKQALADYVIDNSGARDALEPQVMRLDQVLRLLVANPEFI
jgi:dephospho-CoA kinase